MVTARESWLATPKAQFWLAILMAIVIVVTLFTIWWPGRSAGGAASADALDCWLPLEVAGQPVRLTRRDGPEPVIHFRSDAPVAVRLRDGSAPVPGAAVPADVVLAEAAGRLQLTDAQVLIEPDSGGAFVAARSNQPPRRHVLVAAEGTPLRLNGEGLHFEADGRLPPTSGRVMFTAPEASDAAPEPLRASFGEAATLFPVQSAFDPSRVDIVRSDMLPSPQPARSLKVRIHKPGIAFQAPSLLACIRTGEQALPAPIMDADTRSDGLAVLTIDLPRALMPAWSTPATVGLIQADGTFIGHQHFRIVGMLPAVVVAVAAVVLGHRVVGAFCGITRKDFLRERWLSWFTGVDGRASLSLFQIYLWTWVVFAGLVYVFVLTGQFFAITPQVLMLLGIAGTGSVAARVVAASQGKPVARDGHKARFQDIFLTDAEPDLYKLQMFLFTAATAAYVLLRILIDQSFPEIDDNLLLLLGISNGIYVGSKIGGGETAAQRAARLDTEWRLLGEARARIEDEVTRGKANLERLTGEADTLRTRIKEDGDAARAKDRDDLARAETDAAYVKAQVDAAQVRLTQAEKDVAAKEKERRAAIDKLVSEQQAAGPATEGS